MTALIVEDSPPALERLVNRLEKYCPSVDVVAKAKSIDEAVQLAFEYQPDLVFLDIEFPEKSGFDFLAETSGLSYQVIFNTAFNDYAVRAFEYSAVHYILKSDDPQKLIYAVKRAETLSHQNLKPENKALEANLNYNLKNPTNPRIAFAVNRGFETREVNDLLWCQAFTGGYTDLHAKGCKKLTIRKPLNQVEQRLVDFSQFFRISQSFLINVQNMAAYRYDGKSAFVIMDDGEKLQVSSRNRQPFEKFLKDRGILPE
jgi:two-component system LytT family response regulator